MSILRLSNSTYNRLPIFRVGEPDANGLVDEEDVGLLVPGVWVEGRVVGVGDPTRPCIIYPLLMFQNRRWLIDLTHN